MSDRNQGRRDLLDVIHAALAAVDGRRAVRAALESEPPQRLPVVTIAIGKAADSMSLGARDALGDGVFRALVITKDNHCGPELRADRRYEIWETAHPVPDQRCLDAGERLLEFIGEIPGDTPLLFLISGGASSLVEALEPGLDLAFLARTNAWLLASGLDITAMNRVRKGLSRIKGGRLATYLGDRPASALMVSDVPGDDPAVIGSGALVASTPGQMPENLPEWLSQQLRSPPDRVAPIPVRIVACLEDAKQAAASRSRELGYTVTVDSRFLGGDAVRTGKELAARLLEAPAGLTIYGGETTVHLPVNPGRGGRNQALALAAATVLEGHEDVFLAALGTDGTDGPTEDAGGLVDGGTVSRGESQGHDATDCLRRADSGHFLEASGDLITTGPTGTNVMDLLLALKLEP